MSTIVNLLMSITLILILVAFHRTKPNRQVASVSKLRMPDIKQAKLR